MKLQPYHFITPDKPDNEAELKDWEAKFGAKLLKKYLKEKVIQRIDL